jgi:transglutaminase-like putative cysteine protease
MRDDMKQKNLRFVLYGFIAALAAAAVPCAAAQAAAFEPNVTVLGDDIVYDVHADGTFTRVQTERFRLNTDQAVKKYAQVALPYSASLQDLAVEEAYTTTKDGKRIDVAPDQIIVQQSRQSAGAPMFDDGKVKTVIFPGVEIGATLTLRARTTQHKALFPGQFSAIEYFANDNARQSSSVTVRAPSSLELHVDAIDMKGGGVASGQPGTQQWQWTVENVPAHALELGSVSTIDHSPRVTMTTFPDFAAVGAAYLAGAQPKAAVTPDIQALADSLTKGVTDPRAQAEILYDWVSTNIRYVLIWLDVGGVVPHDAGAILASKYGDCKDHVTLLEALLAAKGIRSSPVLVNLGSTYWLPGVAAPFPVFNHAISYLPDFKLFVDSTAGVARFGTLPIAELGKPALVTDDGSGEAKIVTLPLGDPNSANIEATMRVTLNSDGDLTGTSEIKNAGAYDLMSRLFFSSVAPGAEEQLASRILTLTGQNGTGTFKHSEIRDLTQPFVYQTEFALPDYAQFPGPGAIRVPAGLSSVSGIAAAFEQDGPETRDFAMPVANREVTETTIITLPNGIEVPQLPKPANVVSPLVTYSSSYVADGRTITVTRKLVISLAGPLVTPDQYREYRKMGRAVQRDLRTQLVY